MGCGRRARGAGVRRRPADREGIEIAAPEIGDARQMKRVACLLFAAAVGCVHAGPAFAQGSLGGAKKPQNYVGGAASQKNLVVPAPHGAPTGGTTATVRKPGK